MTWRDDLLPAELGGVPFFYEAVDDTRGRDVTVHKLLGGTNVVQDMGDTAAVTKIQAFFLGPNYHLDWRRFEEMLNRPGPKRLVHPFREPALVALDGPYTSKHSVKEGGFVRVDFGVVYLEAHKKAPRPRSPVIEGPREAILGDETLFEEPRTLVQRDWMIGGLEDALAGVQRVTAAVSSELGKFNSAQQLVREIRAQVGLLVGAPRQLFDRVAGVFFETITPPSGVGSNPFNSLLPTPAEKYYPPPSSVPAEQVLRRPANGGHVVRAIERRVLRPGSVVRSPRPSASGGTEVILSQNKPRDQVIAEDRAKRIVFAAALIGYSRGVQLIPLASQEEAEQAIASSDALFRDFLNDAEAPSKTVTAIADLRTQVLTYLRDAHRTLPQRRTVVLEDAIPSLLLAFRLYGNVEREQELVWQNNGTIRDPSFVPSGLPLKYRL